MDPALQLAASFGAERAWELLRYLRLRRRAGPASGTFVGVVEAVVQRHPGLVTDAEANNLEAWLQAAPFDELLELANGPAAPVEVAICTDVFESHIASSNVDLPARLAADRVRAATLIAALWEALLRSSDRSIAGQLSSEARRADSSGAIFEFLQRLALDHEELLNEGLADREAIAGLQALYKQLLQRLDGAWHLLPPLVTLRAPSYAAPSRLLRPRHAIVPFVHRRDELAALMVWADSPPAVLVGSVTGPAGSGKTRLAAEFCTQLIGNDHRWQAGFLDAGSHSGREQAISSDLPVDPTCIVVDYAEAHTATVKLLILRACSQQSRLRVLMLERHPASPQDPFSRLRYDADEVDEVLDSRPQLHMSPTAFSKAQHLPYLRAAEQAFALALNVDVSSRSRPDAGSTPLELSIAALSSVLVQGDYAGPEALVPALMKHEERYWQATSRSAGLDAGVAVLRQCVAVAALVADGVTNETELAEYLGEVDLLQSSSMAERRQHARWLRRTYPGEGSQYVARLEPDLLSEYLVAAVAL